MAALSRLYGERKSEFANTYKVEFDPALKMDGLALESLPNETAGGTTVIQAYAPYMICDTGGFDTLDLQKCLAPAYVNLEEGAVRIGSPVAEVLQYGGMSTFLSSDAPTITMFPTTLIESVRGTNLADHLVGSSNSTTPP